MCAQESEIAPTPLPLAAGERGTPLSPVDIAWLRMDEPINRMHVHGVLVLEGDVARDVVAKILGERLGAIPRFRQRIAGDGGRLVWTDDAAFDLDRHVVEEHLAEPGGDAELAAAIEARLGEGFDRRHPLWQFRVLRGYRGAQTAVFARLHHTIGDGVALMLVLLAMTDLAPQGPPTVEPGRDLVSPPLNPFLEILAAGPRAGLAAARAAAEQWAPEMLRLMLGPAEAYARLSTLAKSVGATRAVARILGSWNEPPTAFKGALGAEKRVAWTEHVRLDEVRSIGRGLGGTVNDVLNTAMAGGLRRYLAGQGTPAESLSFRCAMPVNLRPLEEMAALGNRFGLIFLDLPVGISDPLRRLEEIRRRSERLKRSVEPLVVLSLLDIAGRSPVGIQRLLVKIFGAKATAVFTNVPGPTTTLWFAGRPLREIFFWVPQAGRLGLGVSILSYDGWVRMGVGTDAGLVGDPERIVAGFHAELDALASAAARG
jgi:diacylglycerol O-acyltransferase / wax synthase